MKRVIFASVVTIGLASAGWADAIPGGGTQPNLNPALGEHDCSQNYHPSMLSEHDSTAPLDCDSDGGGDGIAKCSASRVNVWMTSVTCSGDTCSGQGSFKCGTRGSVGYNVTGCARRFSVFAGMEGFNCADANGRPLFCQCVWETDTSWTLQGNSCN